MRRTLAPRLASASLLTLASLAGCAGHGKYTQERVNAAGERMAQLKSGTEWQMAQQQFLAGELDKSLKTIDRSIALNDKVSKSHLLRGRILVEKGRMEDGRNAFLKAEELDPENVEAQYYLGIVHERFNDPEEALARYQKAMQLDATNAQYVVAASDMLVQLGRIEEAERLLEHRRADFQYNAALRQALGHIAMMRGEGEKAVTLFGEAQLLAPDDMPIVEDLMRAQLSIGQFADAEYNADKLLKHEQYKDRRDLKLLRARCLLNTDRPVEARALLVELTDTAEGARDFDTFVDLGQACIVLEDRTRLRNVASRLIATAPERYEGHLFRAMYYRMDGNLPAALDAVETAVARSTVDANPLMLKGMILQELNLPQQAQQAFAAAVALEPDRAAARQLLAAASSQQPGIANVESGSQISPGDR